MRNVSLCCSLILTGVLAVGGRLSADLPESEIKRLEQIVSTTTKATLGLRSEPELSAITKANAEVRRAAHFACLKAVEGGAYSVLGVALRNPDTTIWVDAIIQMTKIPSEGQRELLIPALITPPWLDQAQMENEYSKVEANSRASAQGSLAELISRALGEKIRFDHFWSADERLGLVERLHTELGLPIPPGQFTVRGKGPIHSKVRLPSPAAGVGANPGIGEPRGRFGGAAPSTREAGAKSWLIDYYLVAAIGSLVAAMAVWFFLRSKRRR